MSIRVAILTVSDTASKDSSADKSGPTIQQILENEPGFSCLHAAIVPDDILQIQSAIKTWAVSNSVDWIITTGGTGFGVRDKTPEAVTPLLEREASGLVHLLLSSSLRHTPLAALSRPVAGTVKDTLVVTLPGSVKAVKESLEALLTGGVIEHAIELIKGGSGKAVHSAMSTTGQDPYHHHHEGHHVPKPRTVLSHDPSGSVSTRHRTSPFPIISFNEALEIIHKTIVPLRTHLRPVTASLRGYILAEDVYAPTNVPGTKTTNVDGYALRSTDAPGIYNVLTPQLHKISSPLREGYIYRINTGAPLPVGTDAVIMVEDTKLVSTYDQDGTEDGEEKSVETLVQILEGENVRLPGSDIREGDLALSKGECITGTGGEIGTLAFVGRKEVLVHARPIVAILSTGNEITDLHSPGTPINDDWRGIWDTNRPSLQAALEGFGYEVIDLGVVPDEITTHVEAIKSGLEKADILLTTGGTSMGSTDLLKPVIERHFNGIIHFGRVSVKPGKPTTFATIPYQGISKPVFALPGNPASALVTFYIFVIPALRKLGGWPDSICHLPRVDVKVQSRMKLDKRTEFHRAIINHKLQAFSTGGQRSSKVASLNGANGLVILPQSGSGFLEVGDTAEAILIGEIHIL